MDADEAHNIFALSEHVDLAEVHVILSEIPYVPDEIKKTHIARPLIGDGLLDQHSEIRRALSPAGKCRDIVQVTGPGQDLPDELMDRRIGNAFPDPSVK